MTGPLRITMVLPTLARAGMETVAARLAVDLAERRHRVAVVCIESGGPLETDLSRAGVTVAVVPAPGLQANIRAPALVAWLRQELPDVVHTHSGAWLKGARAARAARRPAVVHTVHGLLDREPWHSNLLKRWAAAYSNAIVTVSDPLSQYMRRSVRLSSKGLHTIPNGIDTCTFSPDGPDRRAELLPGSTGRIVIGCVARFEPVKNHGLLLRAFREAHAIRPELLLVLVGEGSMRASAEADAAMLGIEESVRFVGDQADMPSWYRCFDVFALASRAEGTSMSILEAMACGRPVIATDVGGNQALLGGDESGTLVPSGEAGALAAAIVDVTSSLDKAARMGAAGRRRVIELYSQRTMVDRYEALYRAVLASE